MSVMGDGDGMAFENGTGLGHAGKRREKRKKRREREERESVADRPHPLEATKKFSRARPLFSFLAVFVVVTPCVYLYPLFRETYFHHVTSTGVHSPRNNHRARRPWQDNFSGQSCGVKWDHQRASRWNTALSRQRCRRTAPRYHHESICHWIATRVQSSKDIAE